MKEYPRIVFYGTPEFAVASLDAMIRAGFPVVGVVTALDKAAGRGLSISESAVKDYALDHSLPVFQPEKLKSPEFTGTLAGLSPDLQVVVAFRMLPKEVWSMAPMGTFNLHASLLPQYRGAAPINRAIMNGETETGVTTFFINEEIDTGRVLMQESLEIFPDENAGELHDRLMALGAGLVVKTVQGIVEGSLSPAEQGSINPDKDSLKPAPKIHKSDTLVDWNQDTQTVYNMIRGLTPEPGVSTWILLRDGSSMQVRIGKAIPLYDDRARLCFPGTVITDRKKSLRIATQNGFVEIMTLQPQSKKLMNIRDFLNGSGSRLA